MEREAFTLDWYINEPLLLYVHIACAACGFIIGNYNERPWMCMFIGFLFGPLGVIAAGFLPDGIRRCTTCEGWNHSKAKVCRHCGTQTEFGAFLVEKEAK